MSAFFRERQPPTSMHNRSCPSARRSAAEAAALISSGLAARAAEAAASPSARRSPLSACSCLTHGCPLPPPRCTGGGIVLEAEGGEKGEWCFGPAMACPRGAHVCVCVWQPNSAACTLEKGILPIGLSISDRQPNSAPCMLEKLGLNKGPTRPNPPCHATPAWPHPAPLHPTPRPMAPVAQLQATPPTARQPRPELHARPPPHYATHTQKSVSGQSAAVGRPAWPAFE